MYYNILKSFSNDDLCCQCDGLSKTIITDIAIIEIGKPQIHAQRKIFSTFQAKVQTIKKLLKFCLLIRIFSFPLFKNEKLKNDLGTLECDRE